ncbi:beta strand repeat-containing protein [Dactylosporangium sucinum]|uniref:Ig-like domain-containing protein n=1 Tax=Dactylosporangium sucinum TaxID=1424081 RepID=A0A917UDC3_9ACTN|nr:hypothetical protein [Dactylosporangium sucinum]GGM81065.1 hypothetical protein GCM10007977_098090 [Dactylosporangium sucinum]
MARRGYVARHRQGMRLTLARVALPFLIAGGAGLAPGAALAAPAGPVNILATPQTITFPALPDTPWNGTAPVPAATSDSNLPVTYSSLNTGVCTIAGSAITLVAMGTCTIAADQAGDGAYDPASQETRSFEVTQKTQAITFAGPGNTQLSQTPALSATADSALTVDFASTTPSTCTVSGTTLTPVTVGSCTVTADQAGDTDWAAAPQVSRTFQITKNAQTITPNTPGTTAITAGTVNLTATASSGLTVAYTAVTPSVCTLADSTLTLVAGGTCTVDADQAGNATFAAAPQVAISFSVTKEAQSITFADPADTTLDASPVALTAGATSTLPVTFTSGSPSVCTVSVASVTLLTAGTCLIHADQAGNGHWAAATRTDQSFAVAKGAQTVTFTQPADRALDAAPLTVAPTATSGLTVTLASTTTGVCTVSAFTITAVAAGTCTVEAGQAGNADWNAATTVSRSFTVTKGAQAITFTAPSGKVLADSPVTVSATASSGLAVTFSSKTADVCTVSGTTVTLVKTGTCTLTASQPGDADWNAAAAVDRGFTVAGNGQTITFGALTDKALDTGTVAVSATASSTLPVVFTSATPLVCTVSGTTVTLVRTGTCTVSADQAGDADYAAAPQVQRSFTVTTGSQTVTFATIADRTFDAAPLTVAPTASSGLTVALTSATPAVCTVAGRTVTAVAAGTCTVNADQAGNTDWNAATTVARSFEITKGAQAITFTPPASTALSDGPVTVAATAGSGLTVAFTSTTTDVCTVSGTSVTLVKVGTCGLSAAQAGNANWTAATPVARQFSVIQDPVPVTVPADGPPAGDGTLGNSNGSTAVPGGTVTLSGSGYKANTTITLVVYSTPVELGTTTTDSGGAFSVTVPLPASLASGTHTLVAAGLAPDNTLRYLSVPVAVASEDLAVTGAATGALGVIGAWAVVIGAVLRLLGGRRTWLRSVYRPRHAA